MSVVAVERVVAGAFGGAVGGDAQVEAVGVLFGALVRSAQINSRIERRPPTTNHNRSLDHNEMGRPPLPSNVICYHCGSSETSKAGITREGSQRFYCRGGCRRFFRENPQVPEGKTNYRKKAGDRLPSAGNLVLELQVIAQSTGRIPTTTLINSLSKAGRTHSLNTYYAVFGSFLEAMKRAKLKPRYKQEFNDADRERMLAELRRLRRRLKRPIYDEDVDAARRKDLMSPPYHLQLAFGSVPKAIALAGAGEKKWSRDQMIGLLKRLDEKLGRAVLKRDLEEEFHARRGPSYKAVVKEFGGIANARMVVGISMKK